jgi:glycerophosphoryl diester phosphodiesterase
LSCILTNFIWASPNSSKKTEYNPLLIAHRGASGSRPENTEAAFKLALDQKAEALSFELVVTKDAQLILRHDNEISETTDVAAQFASRKTTKTIDGVAKTGWFSEDLTLKEIKKLRAVERLKFRNHSYDGQFEVLSLSDFFNWFNKTPNLKNIKIFIELRHPTYFKTIGFNIDDLLIKNLKTHSKVKKNIYIESVELGVLKKIHTQFKKNLIFKLEDKFTPPYDLLASGNKTRYIDLVAPRAIEQFSADFAGFNGHKGYVLPLGEKDVLRSPTDFVERTHAQKLKLYVNTLRSDGPFLNAAYKGDPLKEYEAFFKQNVDGVFTDFPDQAVAAKEAFLKQTR